MLSAWAQRRMTKRHKAFDTRIVFYGIELMYSWIRIHSMQLFKWLFLCALRFSAANGSPRKNVYRIQVPHNCGSKLRDECDTHRNSHRIGRQMHICSFLFTRILCLCWASTIELGKSKQWNNWLLLMGILDGQILWNEKWASNQMQRHRTFQCESAAPFWVWHFSNANDS